MFSPCLSIIGSCDTKIQLKKILNNNCSFTVIQKYPAKPKPMKLLSFFLRIKFRLAMHTCTLYHLLKSIKQEIIVSVQFLTLLFPCLGIKKLHIFKVISIEILRVIFHIGRGFLNGFSFSNPIC